MYSHTAPFQVFCVLLPLLQRGVVIFEDGLFALVVEYRMCSMLNETLNWRQSIGVILCFQCTHQFLGEIRALVSRARVFNICLANQTSLPSSQTVGFWSSKLDLKLLFNPVGMHSKSEDGDRSVCRSSL